MRNQYRVLTEKYERVLEAGYSYSKLKLSEPITDRESSLIEILKQGKLPENGIPRSELGLAVLKLGFQFGPESKEPLYTQEQINDFKRLVNVYGVRINRALRRIKDPGYEKRYDSSRWAAKYDKLKSQTAVGNWKEWVEGIVRRKWNEYPMSDPKFNPEKGIDAEYILSIWPSDNKCPVTGRPFSLRKQNEDRGDSPEIDRIDSSANGPGYTKGNVAIISRRANTIKNNGTEQEVRAVANWLKNIENAKSNLNEATVNGVDLPQEIIDWVLNVLKKLSFDKAVHGAPRWAPPLKIEDYNTKQLEMFKNEIYPKFGHLKELDKKTRQYIVYKINTLAPDWYEKNLAQQRAKKVNALSSYEAGNFGPVINYLLRYVARRTKVSIKDLKITADDVLKVFPADKKCPALGINMVPNYGIRGPSSSSPSIDKIVPALGYVPGNIAVISSKANKIKQDATADEIYAVADYMSKQKALQNA